MTLSRKLPSLPTVRDNNDVDRNFGVIERHLSSFGAVSGQAVLAGGTVVVNFPDVTDDSIIQLTSNSPGGTPGWLSISERVPKVSFTILSSDSADTSTVGWTLIEEA